MVIRAGNQIQSGPGRGGRVVEGAALEKRYTFTGIVGSNPTLSAILRICTRVVLTSVPTFRPTVLIRAPLHIESHTPKPVSAAIGAA